MSSSPTEREYHTLPRQTLCYCPPDEWKEKKKIILIQDHKEKVSTEFAGKCFNTKSKYLHIKTPTQLFNAYLEADILQMVGVPLNDLLDEIWMCGF